MSDQSQIGNVDAMDRLIKAAFIFSEWSVYYLLVTAIADCRLYCSHTLLSCCVIRLNH